MKTSTTLCLGLLITFAFLFCVPVIIVLNRNFKDPRFYIQEFYVPALDLSQNTTSNIYNPCLFFDLAIHNVLIEEGVLYGDVNLTFSYNRNTIADYVVPGFYQGNGKTAHRREVVESRGVPWENVLKAVSNGSAVVFRVDLAAWPSYHDGEGYWYSKKNAMRIGADVEVDECGMKVNQEDIRLRSATFQRGVGIFVLFLSLLLSLQCLLN